MNVFFKDENVKIERVVCKEHELGENKIMIAKLDKQEILLVKQKGQIFATGSKCTHYGAPLCNGALGEGRIRCPWHGACFDLRTGDIEDLPIYNSLQTYEVRLEDGKVIVTATKDTLKSNGRVKPFVARSLENPTTFVIVGGGPAGMSCVKHLREHGYDGQVVFIIGEKYLPYDRVKLSKTPNLEITSFKLKECDYYNERQIDLKVGIKLVEVNHKAKKITLSDRETMTYDKLFLATGSSPKQIVVPGSDLNNIYYLRNLDDYMAIGKAITPKAAVIIIGASFIGMEVAAGLMSKVKSITVIGNDTVPFKKSLGTTIGTRLMKLYEEMGVKFEMEAKVAAFVADDGETLSGILLKNQRLLEANICIVGIGIVPNTSFLKGKSSLTSQGCIDVDAHLRTKMRDVYAGGDIAYAPVLGTKESIGHWQVASYHGRIAALNMIGGKMHLNTIPVFWTVLFGKSLRYCGIGKNVVEVQIEGDLEAMSFAAFYINNKKEVTAILASGKDPVASCFAELLHKGERLHAANISEWLRKALET